MAAQVTDTLEVWIGGVGTGLGWCLSAEADGEGIVSGIDAAKSAAEQFAREWVAAQAAALGDGWISVEERLPEDDNVQVMVLAFHPTCNVAPFYAFAYYKRETGLFCAGGGGVYGNLTHWRLLPPLPEATDGK